MKNANLIMQIFAAYFKSLLIITSDKILAVWVPVIANCLKRMLISPKLSRNLHLMSLSLWYVYDNSQGVISPFDDMSSILINTFRCCSQSRIEMFKRLNCCLTHKSLTTIQSKNDNKNIVLYANRRPKLGREKVFEIF